MGELEGEISLEAALLVLVPQILVLYSGPCFSTVRISECGPVVPEQESFVSPSWNFSFTVIATIITIVATLSPSPSSSLSPHYNDDIITIIIIIVAIIITSFVVSVIVISLRRSPLSLPSSPR